MPVKTNPIYLTTEKEDFTVHELVPGFSEFSHKLEVLGGKLLFGKAKTKWESEFAWPDNGIAIVAIGEGPGPFWMMRKEALGVVRIINEVCGLGLEIPEALR